MAMLAAWLLYPLVLAALSLGLGLLVERAADWRVPGPLALPLGFALLLVVVRLVTNWEATAPAALPIVLLLTVAGFASGRERLRSLRPDPWMVAVAVAVLLVYGSPVLASGHPTFAGYLALPDTGHQLALAHLYATHGPDWKAFTPGSSFYEGVAPFILTSYPVAAQAALGVTAPLGAIDAAWLYQPLLSVMAAGLALALASLVAPALARRWQVALVAFIGAQPALVIGFAFQGSIKELAGIVTLATTLALARSLIAERRPVRSLLSLVVPVAAALGGIGPVAAAFLVLAAVAAGGLWGVPRVRRRERADLAWALVVIVAAAVLAWPVLSSLQTQLSAASATLDAGVPRLGFNSGGDLGNLAAPLDAVQVLGVWLSGDYRYRTLSLGTQQDVALWITGALAVLGLGWCLRRRLLGPLLLIGSFGPAAVYLLSRGSPYADAKVLMLLSPAILLMAILGAVCLWRGPWRALGGLAIAAVVASVLWSNALAYHDASLGPYARYTELLKVDDRFAGQGRMLVTEYDEFGKYFLRDIAEFQEPEADHVYRTRPYHPNAVRDPHRRPSLKTPVDMDDLRLRYVESFPLILLRRSPTASRPPSNYRRVWQGRFYEVWRRAAAPRVLSHAPLGRDVLHPAAVVTTRTARAWAQRARRLHGRIAVAEREPLAYFYVSRVPRPSRWAGFGNFPDGLVTDGPGAVDAPVMVPRAGRYEVWVEGSFSRRIEVSVDNRALGVTPRDLNNPGAYELLGSRALRRGIHGVQLLQGGGDLRPGNGGYRSSLRHIGPIVFERLSADDGRVVELSPARWRALVGVRADWLEIVRR